MNGESTYYSEETKKENEEEHFENNPMYLALLSAFNKHKEKGGNTKKLSWTIQE